MFIDMKKKKKTKNEMKKKKLNLFWKLIFKIK